MMSLPTHSDHIITKWKTRGCQMSLRQGGLVAGFRIWFPSYHHNRDDLHSPSCQHNSEIIHLHHIVSSPFQMSRCVEMYEIFKLCPNLIHVPFFSGWAGRDRQNLTGYRDIVFPFHFQDTPDLESVADWQILFHLCRAFSVGVGVGGDRQHLAGSRDSCRRRCWH